MLIDNLQTMELSDQIDSANMNALMEDMSPTPMHLEILGCTFCNVSVTKIRKVVEGVLMILATKPKQPHHVDGVWIGGVVSHNGPWCRSRQAMERWLGQ